MTRIDRESSKEFKKLLKNAGFLSKSQLSVSIYNFADNRLIEYNPQTFVYPAGVSMVFIAAEVINQIELERFGLDTRINIVSPNDIDKEAEMYPTNVYPILKAGDNVTIDMLLTLMLGRDDKTAANTLIDLVSRTSINNDIINRYSWDGSEITRKFLNRKFEDNAYAKAPNTMSCSRHLASFLKKVENNELISPFVSSKLKQYMSLNLQNKPSQNWLSDLSFGKDGWAQDSSYNPIKLISGRKYTNFQSQIGVVSNNNHHYAVSILSKHHTSKSEKRLDFAKLSELIPQLIG